MKKLLLVLILMALIVPSCVTADGPQYEVTIHVVYNSIPEGRAAEIIKDAQKRYGDACKVEVNSKKINDDNLSSATIFYDTGETCLCVGQDGTARACPCN